MTSVFMDKEVMPTTKDLKKALGITYAAWQALADFTKSAYPAATEEWNFSNVKYGWSFRIRDKKRVIVYLLPRNGFFKISLVFGQKATDAIFKNDIADTIKAELKNAKVYAEGRGIRIEVKDNTNLNDFKKLITIKISN